MIPERYAAHTYALFRIVAGFLFTFHGLQKLFGWFGGQVMLGSPMMAAAGCIETFGGVLIMMGLFTSPVAFVASGMMAVAYFTAHQPRGMWPIQNQGELAALFCFAFLYIATRGPGIWSVDSLRRRPVVGVIPERYLPQAYALLRIAFGLLWLFHGLQKVFGMYGGRVAEMGTLRGTAGIIECVAGAMIMAGLLTRPMAFIASGQMAVAYFLSHQPAGRWPIQNRGELAALYSFAFLHIASCGAGLWSLDALGAWRSRLLFRRASYIDSPGTQSSPTQSRL